VKGIEFSKVEFKNAKIKIGEQFVAD